MKKTNSWGALTVFLINLNFKFVLFFFSFFVFLFVLIWCRTDLLDKLVHRGVSKYAKISASVQKK